MARHTFTDRSGRTWATNSARPYFVRCGRSRSFGSLPAARAYAHSGVGTYSIFFDYAPGEGVFIEGGRS